MTSHSLSSPLVSVLIVTYNAKNYIRQTLKSCVEQTYVNIEILILDNHSSDHTVDILKNFSFPVIHLFQQKKNSGPYGGLNLLLPHAKGKYIAVQDHDDIWFPEKLKAQVDFLEKNPAFIACGTQYYLYFEEKKIFIHPNEPFLTDFVGHPSLMFRNENFRYREDIVLADEDFEKNILRRKGKIACLYDALLIHRIKSDGTNLSTRRFSLKPRHVKDFFELNRLSYKTLLYFVSLLTYHHIPNTMRWFIRRRLTFKNAQWLTLEEFKKRFPSIEL